MLSIPIRSFSFTAFLSSFRQLSSLFFLPAVALVFRCLLIYAEHSSEKERMATLDTVSPITPSGNTVLRLDGSKFPLTLRRSLSVISCERHRLSASTETGGLKFGRDGAHAED